MSSRIDDLVTALATAMGDTSVAFEAGKLRLHEQSGARRIIFVRASGKVQAAATPGRVRLGTAVAGTQPRGVQVFTREELIAVTLRAEGETELDALLDSFLDAVFHVYGPNALPGEYEWFDGDSKDGGGWNLRQPAIRLILTVKLRSLPTARTNLSGLTAAGATVQMVNAEGSTAVGDAENVFHLDN